MFNTKLLFFRSAIRTRKLDELYALRKVGVSYRLQVA